MTCDTAMLQGRDVAFSLSEAEIVWPAILEDAASGGLRPVYGRDERWQLQLDSPVLRLRPAGTSAGTPFRCSASTRRAAAPTPATSAR
jgi:hypothetical protein